MSPMNDVSAANDTSLLLDFFAEVYFIMELLRHLTRLKLLRTV